VQHRVAVRLQRPLGTPRRLPANPGTSPLPSIAGNGADEWLICGFVVIVVVVFFFVFFASQGAKQGGKELTLLMVKLLNKLSLERRHHKVKTGTIFNEDLDRYAPHTHAHARTHTHTHTQTNRLSVWAYAE
jgi:hypothetical protein